MVKSRQHRTMETDLMGYAIKPKTINSKMKGNANEREACKWLKLWTGEYFARVPSSGGLRWKNNSTVCGDVVCENEAFKFIFSVETKHLKTLHTNSTKLQVNSAIFTIWRQALADAERGKKIPILMLRKNGMPLGEYYIVFDVDTVRKIDEEISFEYEFFGLDKEYKIHLYGYKSNYVLDKIPYKLFVV